MVLGSKKTGFHSEIAYGEEVRNKILEGIEKAVDLVQVTLGPGGRNVMIQKGYTWPHTTKDGVTVLRDIYHPDPFSNMAVQYLKQASIHVCDQAGDGTTTCAVLSRAIYKEGCKLLSTGYNQMELKRGIDWAAKYVVNRLKEVSTPINDFEEIEQVAIVSANGDKEIGSIITEATRKVGKDGTIIANEGGLETKLFITEGFEFDRGHLSHIFETDKETGEATYEDPLILLYDGVLRNQEDLLKVFKLFKPESIPPLVVIAEDIVDKAFELLAFNRQKTNLRVLPIKAPGYGSKRSENMLDLAFSIGARLVDPSNGDRLEDLTLKDFGSCSKIISTKDQTTILEGKGDRDQLNLRVCKLKNEKANASYAMEVEALDKRIARLTGAVAVISVGASSEVEMKEKKDRVDDALSAAKAATEEGIVPGGGITLYRLAQEVPTIFKNESKDFIAGVMVFKKACEVPFRAILENANIEDSSMILSKLKKKKFEFGYNIRSGKIQNLIEVGIIDPAKVTRSVVENATSVATMLLTTDGMLIQEIEEN